jgi:hypothetical protein
MARLLVLESKVHTREFQAGECILCTASHLASFFVVNVNAPSVKTSLVCGCHFSFAVVITCTRLPSLYMYLLLVNIDNNNVSARFGYVHHANNIVFDPVEPVQGTLCAYLHTRLGTRCQLRNGSLPETAPLGTTKTGEPGNRCLEVID